MRESTEGLFSSRKETFDTNASSVTDRLLITRKGSERIIRAAFKAAMMRRRQLALVDKANVLPSMAFFRQIFDEIAPEYPEVTTQRLYVDAVALYLVQKPESFDVLVTENMFGDIITDLTAGLVGGMGMGPSADIGGRVCRLSAFAWLCAGHCGKRHSEPGCRNSFGRHDAGLVRSPRMPQGAVT